MTTGISSSTTNGSRSARWGTGTFQGNSALMQSDFDASNRLTAKSYYTWSGRSWTSYGAESFNTDATQGAIGELIATTTYTPSPFSYTFPTSGDAMFSVVTHTKGSAIAKLYAAFGMSGDTLSANTTLKITPLAAETVTVPAGTFTNACRFELSYVNSLITTGPFGALLATAGAAMFPDMKIYWWTAPGIGIIKSEATVTVNTMAGTSTTKTTEELQSGKFSGTSYP